MKKGKATHSSILAWRIPWGQKELDTTEAAAADFQANKTNEEFIGRRSRDAKV